MKIIVFAGATGSGKSLAAEIAEAYAAEDSQAEVQILHIKTPLLRAAVALNPALFARYERLLGADRDAARAFLCDVGAVLDRHFPGVLVERLAITLRAQAVAEQFRGAPRLVIIDDLRRVEELDLLREEWPAETFAIYLHRPGNPHPRHLLDGLISPGVCDAQLQNDGTVDALAALIEPLVGVVLECQP